MQLSHTGLSLSASFDEPNFVSAGGLVPVMGLARDAGLCQAPGVVEGLLDPFHRFDGREF